MPSSPIESFWSWFSVNAERISAMPENLELIGELDRRVSELNRKISWEIGPGMTKAWQLVLSPNLNPQLRSVTASMIEVAPSLKDWEFFPARQPKEWDYKIELMNDDGGSKFIDASRWRFVLLRYPDGQHEVILEGRNVPELDEDGRWKLAAIALESIVGEDTLMERIEAFSLVGELPSGIVTKARPIDELPTALIGEAESKPK